MKREYLEQPFPHLLVESRKEIHGWYRDQRECTSERMLLNPYNGCSNDCVYCYAKSYPGHFMNFRHEGLVTVFKDFDEVVATQLDSVQVASCGYLSPVTDPFQKLEATYNLSLKVVRAFTERGLPVEFITKCRVPHEVLQLMSGQKHSFGQVSVTTIDEEKRKVLMKEGATTGQLWDEVSAIRAYGLHAVVRIDPIIPFVTDSARELAELLGRACDSGACHVIVSVMDIPHRMASYVFEGLRPFGSRAVYDLRKLYSERVLGGLNARISYRRNLFDFMRSECDRLGLTFALCMEFELHDGEPKGLNREYMSSTNCEGVDIPVYVRDGAVFKPAAECDGNCLCCETALCGLEELALGRARGTKKSFKLSDYRRWSRKLRDVSVEGRNDWQRGKVRSCGRALSGRC